MMMMMIFVSLIFVYEKKLLGYKMSNKQYLISLKEMEYFYHIPSLLSISIK